VAAGRTGVIRFHLDARLCSTDPCYHAQGPLNFPCKGNREGGFSPGANAAEREARYLSAAVDEVQNVWSFQFVLPPGRASS
jgi:hypothetical protein